HKALDQRCHFFSRNRWDDVTRLQSGMLSLVTCFEDLQVYSIVPPAALHRHEFLIRYRLPSETATPNETLVKSYGLDYINIPVNKALLSENQIDDLNAAMQTKQGPFLLHCATGARAALLLALSRARENGWTADQTFAHAQTMGFDLRTSPAYSSFVNQAVAPDTRQADQFIPPEGT
ncbi:MAG: sulfur transferase domain-containing protein, partial [Polaromonas sp.]